MGEANLYGATDGGCRYKGSSATGWVLHALNKAGDKRRLLARSGTLIQGNLISLDSELRALHSLVKFCHQSHLQAKSKICSSSPISPPPPQASPPSPGKNKRKGETDTTDTSGKTKGKKMGGGRGTQQFHLPAELLSSSGSSGETRTRRIVGGHYEVGAQDRIDQPDVSQPPLQLSSSSNMPVIYMI